MGSCPDTDIDLLFVYGKIFARGKIKSERKSYVKKLIKEIKKAQRRKKEYHSVKKGKHSFVFLLWKRPVRHSSTLASRFLTKKSP